MSLPMINLNGGGRWLVCEAFNKSKNYINKFRLQSWIILQWQKKHQWIMHQKTHVRSTHGHISAALLPCKQGPTLLDGQWKHTWRPRPALSAHRSLSWCLRPHRPRSGPAPCPLSLTAHRSVGSRGGDVRPVHFIKEMSSGFPLHLKFNCVCCQRLKSISLKHFETRTTANKLYNIITAISLSQ